LTDLTRTKTELEITVQELEATADQGTLFDLEQELERLNVDVKAKETQLAALMPRWEALRAEQAQKKRTMDEARAQVNALYAKQGRVQQFRTKADRDKYLTEEIASISAHKTKHESALNSARAELQQARTSLQEIEDTIARVRSQASDGAEEIRRLGEEIAKLRDNKAEKSERQRSLQREEAKLDSIVSNANNEFRDADRQLAGMMDKV
jgi:structural maintenance of chromosome 3 (chondroitin sulfate proteoglycan 6)